MRVNLTRHHLRDFEISYGDVEESYSFDIESEWNDNMDMSVYKPFKEISEESKLKMKSFIENYELNGETFYDIDDWYDHFGSYGEVSENYIESYDDIEGVELSDMLSDLVHYMEGIKGFDIFVNPLLHAVQSQVNELKTKREMRKQKAERLIQSIRIGLEKSLKKFDSEIESKLTSQLTTN